MKTKTQNIRRLCECAMLVALATVLSMLKIYEAPLGGSVTLFSMVPIIICGFVYGPKTGFATAFVYSVIQLLLGIGTVAYVPDPLGIVLCILFDYIVAFSVLGVVGFFRNLHLLKNEKANSYLNVALGSLVALILRFACHILSGAVVWYSITKEGAWNDAVFKYSKWVYSVVYNSAFMIPEIILTLVAVPVTVYLIRVVWGRKALPAGTSESDDEKSVSKARLVKLIFGAVLLVGGIVAIAIDLGVTLLILGVVLAVLGVFLTVNGLWGEK